jgi:rare lipoprotein A
VRMSLRFVIALSLPALAVSGGAMADQPPARVVLDSVVQTALITEQAAQLASAVIVAPTAAPAVPAEIAMPVPTGPTPVLDAAAPVKTADVKHPKDKLADKSAKRHRGALTDEAKAMCVQAVGKPETGAAAWYGGRYIGRRTTSGSRLDTIHPTAAHRTLPLNSLARVTNLDNGRSVVVRVTDRGPVSNSLLIDMSPKAADELHMRNAGVVPVKVEQVVEVPADPK